MRLGRNLRSQGVESAATAIGEREKGGRAEEYIGVAEPLLPGGGDEVWAGQPTSGRFQSLPSVLAAILQHAGRFRTLAGHRQALLQAGWQYDGSGYLEGAFRELIDRGLLRSKSAFLAASVQAAGAEAAAAPIATVAWVTRDRRTSLLRSVESFAASIREYGRQLDFAVFDDSPDPGDRELTRAALAGLGRDRGIRIRYAGEEEKREFAQEAVRVGKPDGLPPEVVEFALFDPFKMGYTVGANTNALLLNTTGQTTLCLNDDIVCRFAVPPWGASGGLVLSSAADPTGTRLFADPPALDGATRLLDADALAAHESLLGRSAGDCIRRQADLGEVTCGEMTAGFARALEVGRGRVRVTMAGFYGDSGMGYPVSALFADGESRERLLASEEHYHDAVHSRLVLRAAPSPTLSDSPFLMAANCGLDNREPLPPFFPVLRNSDGLFAHVLRLCVPRALIGHLPLAAAHFPPEHRQFAEGEALRVDPPRLADLVILLVRRLAPDVSRFGPGGIEGLGETLLALSALDAREFQSLARETWAAEMSRHVADLEGLLAAYGGRPEFWAEDVAARIEAVGREVTSEGAFVPSDLGGQYHDPLEAAAFAQRLVGRFGGLLNWWPALLEAAATVRTARGGGRPQ